MSKRNFTLSLGLSLGVLLTAAPAWGQVGGGSLNRQRYRPVQRSSGTSPYLNLFQNFGGLSTSGVPNYQAFVQPQLQQQRQNQRFSRSLTGLQNNYSGLAAQQQQLAGQGGVATNVRPTGRAAAGGLTSYFDNRGAYFPQQR